MAFSIAIRFIMLAAFSAATDLPHPLSDEFISLINSRQNSWKAGRNFAPDVPLSYFDTLSGALETHLPPNYPNKTHDYDLIASLPENFDARMRWPQCSSLHEIGDQGSCGSCWAVGSAATMTDRVCTYSNGNINFHFSAQDLASCCRDCVKTQGCNGGRITKAWEYWRDYGIVSGGGYMSGQGCRPYEFPPCDHTGDGRLPACQDATYTPACSQCSGGYLDYNRDKRRGRNIYHVFGEEHIKAELFTHGPVAAMFMVYQDFIHYKSGVYWHTAGTKVSWHIIKILGWGVENGNKYWLCANSWNNFWGDRGFFKILRGVNHLGIEEVVMAGEPDLNGL